MKGVAAHQLGNLEEVGEAFAYLQGLVELVHSPTTAGSCQNSFAEPGDLLQPPSSGPRPSAPCRTRPRTSGPAPCEGIGAPLPFTERSARNRSLTSASAAAERRMRDAHGIQRIEGDVIRDRIGKDEVAIGQALHERARTEPVRAMVGEVRLSAREQPGDVVIRW